jgi:hypothetical protein
VGVAVRGIELIDVSLNAGAFRLKLLSQVVHAKGQSAAIADELRAAGTEPGCAFIVRTGDGLNFQVGAVFVGRDRQAIEEGVACRARGVGKRGGEVGSLVSHSNTRSFRVFEVSKKPLSSVTVLLFIDANVPPVLLSSEIRHEFADVVPVV